MDASTVRRSIDLRYGENTHDLRWALGGANSSVLMIVVSWSDPRMASLMRVAAQLSNLQDEREVIVVRWLDDRTVSDDDSVAPSRNDLLTIYF